MVKKSVIKVIFEDEDILVLDKPSGISVHGAGLPVMPAHAGHAGKTKEHTVADWILAKYPKLKKVGESDIVRIADEDEAEDEILRPGIVHRLDKETSGVMIVAKTESMYKFLKRQFKDRKISKVYRAIAVGDFKDDSGMIDRPIGRNRVDFRARATGQLARGEMRDAITFYKVLDRFGKYTHIEVRPKTGRTHQIRVHLKSVSKPIACDEIYGTGKECPKGIKRLALHAFSLEIPMPGGIIKKFESPLPKDFETALKNLRK